ncbi:hypothetical protein [Nocardiopsis sp. CNT312]|uniref:hypothetical protein n=1 Tax=Nocardiopsis sp. CNT312 TaxID=1137268 RepID=UPI00048E2B9E|nr:hypothetical protein [Nocardiopsis sp. CNT312]
MTAPAPVSSGVRAVLSAPRGARFTRTRTGTRRPAAEPTRRERVLAQMADNPRIVYRQAHGELPAWMDAHAERIAARDRSDRRQHPDRPAVVPVPRPREAPDDGPARPAPLPPKPPLPRRRSRRPRDGHRTSGRRLARHRRPRRGPGLARLVAAYAMATAVGALAHHLSTAVL